MDYETLGKNGILKYKVAFSGKYSRILQELLKETVRNFANASMKYIRDNGCPDFPFIYNELVLRPPLTYAFFSATRTGLVFTEYPVEKNGKSGRVDYFICEKYGADNQRCFIYIETKFDWISYRSVKNSLIKRTKDKLESGIKQIGSFSLDKEDIVLLLSVLPVYYSFGKKNYKKSEAIKRFRSVDSGFIEEKALAYYSDFKNMLVESLKKNAFLFIWFTPRPDENSLEYESKYETYPAVLFLGTYKTGV